MSEEEGKGKTGFFFCILGGILLIISGSSGNIGFLKEIANILNSVVIAYIITVLGIIASLGGISVIAGTIIAYYGRKRLGKFIIGLGAGMGLIGLIINILLTVLSAGISGLIGIFASLSTISGFGILLSIFGRMKM